MKTKQAEAKAKAEEEAKAKKEEVTKAEADDEAKAKEDADAKAQQDTGTEVASVEADPDDPTDSIAQLVIIHPPSPSSSQSPSLSQVFMYGRKPIYQTQKAELTEDGIVDDTEAVVTLLLAGLSSGDPAFKEVRLVGNGLCVHVLFSMFVCVSVHVFVVFFVRCVC